MTTMTRRVYDLLAAGASLQTITSQLKLPPSRLKRIINSPSYKNEIEMESLVTAEKARLGMIGLGFEAITRIAQLTNGEDEDSARRACTFALDKALGVTSPEEIARAQSLIKTASTLVKLAQPPTKRYSSVQDGIGEQKPKPSDCKDL